MSQASDTTKDATNQDHGAVQHDPEGGRFYIETDGGEARLNYRPEGGDILNFVSTFTSPELRGQGLAEKVVRAGFEYAQEEGKKVRPTCPYIETFLRRNPELRELSTAS